MLRGLVASVPRMLQSEDVSLGRVFAAETTGTALLILIGVSTSANCTLRKLPGVGPSSWLLVCFGWALGVFVGVIAAGQSGAHLNPAVTLGLTIRETLAASQEHRTPLFVPGVAITVASFFTYIAAECVGAAIGALLAWMFSKKHFDEHATKDPEQPQQVRGCFCTAPAIRDYKWNLVTEIIATFVLIFTIFSFDNEGAGWADNLGPVKVMLVILACGTALGGPTGFAMNPARDLMPRLVHKVLPLANKAKSDWGYSWVPILGPLIGGSIAGLLGFVYYDLL